MSKVMRALALSLTATAALLAPSPSAHAAPSCVAQSVQAEHEVYGTAWGKELIAFLNTHPEVLAEFGLDSFGELASFAAQQDPANCPEDL